MTRIYLDHNATTRLDPEARAAMMPFLDEELGNPSSIHGAGRAARDAVERARDQVAALLSASRDEIVFTSGGTEGDNLAVRGLAEAARAADPRKNRVVVSPLEHPAVLASTRALEARGFRVTLLVVDEAGRLDLDEVRRALDGEVALLTVQLANHELGNIFPLAELAERARAVGAAIHTDAVQAATKIAIDVRALGVDALTVSAHKLHGPKGTGAIWLKAGQTLEPHSVGGHQERERRPGTENVAGIVGFGVAAERARANLASERSKITRLRDRLEAGARELGARVNGDLAARTGNTSNLAWEGIEGEWVVQALDLENVCVSTGAACSSGSLEPSPVLLGLGQARARAREAVRFSLGRDNTDEEIDRVLALLPEILRRIRSA